MPKQFVSATDDEGWAEEDWSGGNGWEGRQGAPWLLAPGLVGSWGSRHVPIITAHDENDHSPAVRWGYRPPDR